MQAGGNLEGMGLFHSFIVVVVTWLHLPEFIKIQIKWVNFMVYKLRLNKLFFKMPSLCSYINGGFVASFLEILNINIFFSLHIILVFVCLFVAHFRILYLIYIITSVLQTDVS